MTARWKIAQWFELRWWKNYLRGKNKQQYLAWKRNYWLEIIWKIYTKPEPNLKELAWQTFDAIEVLMGNKTICDLGCGPAGIFIALPQNKVTAVDPLIDEYERQTPFFTKADYPNTTFVKNTIEGFETAGKFDVVFCLNAINHVHDIEKGFEQLAKVSTPEGVIVISIDAHNHSFFKHLFRLIPGDILHPHQYDLEEYWALIERQGMKIFKKELLKKEFFFNHYLMVATKA